MLIIIDDKQFISGILTRALAVKFPDEEIKILPDKECADLPAIVQFIKEEKSLMGIIVKAETECAERRQHFNGLEILLETIEEAMCGKMDPLILSFESLDSLLLTEKYEILLRSNYVHFLKMPFKISSLLNFL